MNVRSIAIPALVLGLLSLHAPATAEAQESIPALTAACDGGNAAKCFELGARYDLGTGVAQDPARAVAPYRRGCDGADASACFNLSLLYYQGRGVPVDLPRAAAFLQRACDGRLAIGCANLGAFYQQGLGVVADQTRAADLSRRACELDTTQCRDRARAPRSVASPGVGSTEDVDLFLAEMAKGASNSAPHTALETSLMELSRQRLPLLVRGVTLEASLALDDYLPRGDDSYWDGYFYKGGRGEPLEVRVESRVVIPWVIVRELEGEFSRMEYAERLLDPARLRFNLPRDGTYLIVVGSQESLAVGRYTLSLDFVSATGP